MTPTDSAEKVVAELIGPKELSALKRHVDHGLVSSGTRQTLASLIALIESQRATIERVERERADAVKRLEEWLLRSEPWQRRAEAAEARVTALEAEKGGFQWFDIESAPKSGDILVCGCSYGPAVRIAHWGNGRFLGRKKGYEQGWSHIPGRTCDPKFWAPIPMAQALSRSSTEVKNDEAQ